MSTILLMAALASAGPSFAPSSPNDNDPYASKIGGVGVRQLNCFYSSFLCEKLARECHRRGSQQQSHGLAFQHALFVLESFTYLYRYLSVPYGLMLLPC